MTLIHCCVDTVKLNIMQRGVLAVSFMVINGKTRYKASKSWKAINLRESWKSQRVISHINKRQWKARHSSLLHFDIFLNPCKIFKRHFILVFNSDQFSHSVISDSFWTFGLQHTRTACPSPTTESFSNSCLSNQWCHPTMSFSVIPFSSCHQSFPASGSFQMNQFSHQVAKVLEFQLQHQPFQWIFRTDFL